MKSFAKLIFLTAASLDSWLTAIRNAGLFAWDTEHVISNFYSS
jgi:hypothetical protein